MKQPGMTQDLPVLIIGYNRPDLLARRLKEVEKFKVNKIYISLDGFKVQEEKEHFREVSRNRTDIIERFKQIHHATIWEADRNLGIATNVSSSITRVLETESQVLVIEEDISVSKESYSSLIIELCRRPLESNEVVNLFTPYTRPRGVMGRLAPNNRWRKTPYFSPWGWIVTRSTWSNYSLELPKEYLEILQESSTWRSLSKTSRSVWCDRFRKVYENSVFTWDYQFQFIMFSQDMKARAPIYRLVENEGFQDSRSTNTKVQSPGWLLGNYNSLNSEFSLNNNRPLLDNAIQFIDENTLVGTGVPLRLFNSLKRRF